MPIIDLSKKWLILKKFWKDVESVTIQARTRNWQYKGAHLERDNWSRAERLAVLDEEIGKLHRCANKIKMSHLIAGNEDEINKWLDEGYFRILTSVSLLRRIAEHWHSMEDK